MKIGVICYPTFGGSGVLATELGMGMGRLGHRVHFITYRKPVRLNAFQENVYFHEVAAEDYPLFEYTPYETALASKMADVAFHEGLDLLHVHYAIPHATAAFLAQAILKSKGIDIPFITTLHGTDITLTGSDKSYAPVVEFGINNSNGVTAVSKSLRKQTLDYFDIKKEIRVIYNFVNFDRFKRTNKEHFKKAIAPEGEKILVHVSNFRKVKRVQDIVRAFSIINQTVASKLLLIGDGPERLHLEELCRSLGICNDIRFLGNQNAVEELLAVADVFMLASEKESFGLAALEAMACEVPVISSDAGGIPEINIDGKTGFVSKVGDVTSMADNTIKLLQDEQLFNQLKAQAKEQAKRFSLPVIVKEYENYYREVIRDYSQGLT